MWTRSIGQSDDKSPHISFLTAIYRKNLIGVRHFWGSLIDFRLVENNPFTKLTRLTIVACYKKNHRFRYHLVKWPDDKQRNEMFTLRALKAKSGSRTEEIQFYCCANRPFTTRRTTARAEINTFLCEMKATLFNGRRMRFCRRSLSRISLACQAVSPVCTVKSIRLKYENWSRRLQITSAYCLARITDCDSINCRRAIRKRCEAEK